MGKRRNFGKRRKKVAIRRKKPSRRLFSKKRKSEPPAFFARKGRRRADSSLCAAERICAALRFAPTRRKFVFRSKIFRLFSQIFAKKNARFRFFRRRRRIKSTKDAVASRSERVPLVSASTEKIVSPARSTRQSAALSVALFFNADRRRRRRDARIDRDSQNNAQGKAA